MAKKEATTVKDNRGFEWHPVLDSWTLRQACKACDLTLAQLNDFESLCGSHMMDLCFYACEDEAKERDLDLKGFWRGTGEDFLMGMLPAMIAARDRDFPQKDDVRGGGESDGPKDPGASKT